MSWFSKLMGNREAPSPAQAAQPAQPGNDGTPSAGGWAGQYDVFVILTRNAESAPWLASNWAKISEVFDPMMQRPRGSAAVRSTQLAKGPGSPNHRAISFGRIGWNAAGTAKWTHAKPGQLTSGQEAEFLTTEAWAPSWTVCQREQQAPDIYLACAARSGPELSGMLVVAVAHAAGDDTLAQARQAVSNLGSVLSAGLVATWTRPWSFPFGKGPLRTSAINDLMVTGLFVTGALPTPTPELAWLEGPWQSLD